MTYYGKRIFVDFFHGLCDANGGIEFLKTIVYYYFKTANDRFDKGSVMTLSDPERKGEVEDAFLKYYKDFDFFDGMKKMAAGNGFMIKDKQFAHEGFGLIQGEVNTESLLSVARSYGCTLTVYIAALALYSVAKVYGESRQKEDFIAFIPINLRKKFPTETMFNFTNFAKCSVPRNVNLDIKEFISFIKMSLSEQLTEDELQLKLSFSSLMGKMPLLKFMPLFIKSFISKVSRDFSSKTKQTLIVSNLGRVNINAGDRVDHFLFNLNCSERTPNNLGVISYGNKTIISFTRRVINTKIEEEFFRILAKECGEVKVISNFREDNDVL